MTRKIFDRLMMRVNGSIVLIGRAPRSKCLIFTEQSSPLPKTARRGRVCALIANVMDT
jgi:hypothetical protein